jgi:LmbE family N-acetylglucosaminyl deacetylase
MHRFAPVALATLLAASAPALLCAQTPTPFTVPPATGHFTDPANLAAERVRPRTGRELPIDGGLGADGQPDNALGLAQLLRKLNTRASLMLIVAHPDDEDGGMLAFYSRGLGARVAILTLNRGEGGQNQMTGDFEDALGLIRTQELLAADRYMGVDTQMFGTEVDFGFSKTKSEAFAKWNHQRVLYDAVRAVRIFRPLVIASVFMGAVTDGHGQHQVSGQIAQEVFKAAGDPNVFPELTKEGILPWQPLKVYARVPFSRVTAQGLYDYATGQTVPAEFTNYVTGQTFTTEPTADVTVHEGTPDPLLTTCAANPADLPASLRSSSVLSSRPEPTNTPSSRPEPTNTPSSRPEPTNTPSSRPEPTNTPSSRPEPTNTPSSRPEPTNTPSSRPERSGVERPLYSARTATDCHPLTYVQFARIGLGLQRTQIGANVRVPRPGPVDVGYHLYGSRICAPNLPNPTPNLCESKSAAKLSSQNLSSRPEAQSAVAERPLYFARLTPALSSRPKAQSAVAERPLYFARLTTALSSRPEAQSAVAERPPYFARPTPALSSRPEAQSAVAERPAFRTATFTAFAAKAPTARPIPALATAPTFFDGIDTSLNGLASLAPGASPLFPQRLAALATVLSSITAQFDPHNPAKIAPALADASSQLDRLIDGIDDLSVSNAAKEDLRHELLVKRAQLDSALALALGLNFDATAPAADLYTGAPVKVTSRIDEASSIELSVKEVHIQVGESGRSNPVEETRADRPLSSDHADQRTLTIPADETETATRPYFFRRNIEEPVYQLAVPSLRNAPATPPPAVAWADLDYRGVSITLGRVVHSGNQPVSFIPPINLSLSAHAQALPLTAHSIDFSANAQTTSDAAAGAKLLFSIPDGWTVKPTSTPLQNGATTVIVYPPQSATTPVMLTAVARTRHDDHIREGFRPVGYGTLPRTNYYTPATLRIVPVDLKLPPPNKRRIAYLPGTGDAVPAALASIGLTPTILKVSDLTPARLARFDTVILGVRTYNAHPDLHGAPTQALFDFARNGGNVVVQYQTPEFSAADAPYPISVAQGIRVVDETAPVKLLDPASSSGESTSRYPEPSGSGLIAHHKENTQGFSPAYALLTTPNRITSADFNNWIEERGHGFPDSWDPHYTALTETHDPGAPAEHIAPQDPQRGGILTVQLGKGRWTYCAFALYRQLPEAVPGAFRLFVNLLNP